MVFPNLFLTSNVGRHCQAQQDQILFSTEENQICTKQIPQIPAPSHQFSSIPHKKRAAISDHSKNKIKVYEIIYLML